MRWWERETLSVPWRWDWGGEGKNEEVDFFFWLPLSKVDHAPELTKISISSLAHDHFRFRPFRTFQTLSAPSLREKPENTDFLNEDLPTLLREVVKVFTYILTERCGETFRPSINEETFKMDKFDPGKLHCALSGDQRWSTGRFTCWKALQIEIKRAFSCWSEKFDFQRKKIMR